MNRQHVLQRMSDCGISVVFRTDDTRRLIPAAAAFCAGGLPVIEFTMTMPDAVSLLERGAGELPEGAVLGAGTVLDAATARTAILAGAQFIVSPVLDPEVVDLCHRYGIAVVPGVMTPTEIMQACRLGVDMVKLFPSCALGPQSLAELLGPFPNLRIVAAAMGGVERIPEYIAAGAEVVCVGGQAVDAVAFAEGRFDALQRRAAELAATVQAARRHR